MALCHWASTSATSPHAWARWLFSPWDSWLTPPMEAPPGRWHVGTLSIHRARICCSLSLVTSICIIYAAESSSLSFLGLQGLSLASVPTFCFLKRQALVHQDWSLASLHVFSATEQKSLWQLDDSKSIVWKKSVVSPFSSIQSRFAFPEVFCLWNKLQLLRRWSPKDSVPGPYEILGLRHRYRFWSNRDPS